MQPNRKAVVLLSGELDSATTLALAMRDGFDVHALSFHYGQRHEVEVAAARRVAERMGVTTPCRVRAQMLADRRSSSDSQAATSGPAEKRIGQPAFARSATPTSSAPTARA